MDRGTYKFSDTLRQIDGKFLKRFLAYIFCTKNNEINIYLSDVQKHVSNEKSYKTYNIFGDKKFI